MYLWRSMEIRQSQVEEVRYSKLIEWYVLLEMGKG